MGQGILSLGGLEEAFGMTCLPQQVFDQSRGRLPQQPFDGS